MELRVLKYFLVVAREKNITRASKMLHITQPTLSRQLHQLEEEFGTTLFHRGKHNITLTTAGLLLYRRASEFAELEEKTAQEMQNSGESIAGPVSIGIGETVSLNDVAEVIKAFQKEYPDSYFDIYTGVANDVKERMENGLLDFGVLLDPVDISEYNFIHLPNTDSWAVLMPENHPLAKKAEITAKDLAGVPLVMAQREAVRNMVENWFGKYKEELVTPIFMNLSAFNKSILVRKGLGVALGLDFGFAGPGLVSRPLTPRLINHCSIAWKKNRFQAPVVARFAEFMADWFTEESELAKSDEDPAGQ